MTPFDAAWTLLKSDTMVRKNVIGSQYGTQYKMPPAIASMAQRPQQPEMMTQQMEVQQQQPGFFGRFRQPTTTMQTTQIPTGANVVGERAGPVQTNSPHPPGALVAKRPAGAQVTRMPRPGPYGSGGADGYNAWGSPSFSTYSAPRDPENRERRIHPLDRSIGSAGNHYGQGGFGGVDPDFQSTYYRNMAFIPHKQALQDLYGDQFGVGARRTY